MLIKTAYVTITPTEHDRGAGHTPLVPIRTMQTAVRVKNRDRQPVLVAVRVVVRVRQPAKARALLQVKDRDQATARVVITARDPHSLMPTRTEFAII